MTLARPLWPWPGCAALVSVLAPCLVASCTGSSASEPKEPKEIVLELWAMGREGEVVTELMPEFERMHPGIRVDVQQIPWTAAH